MSEPNEHSDDVLFERRDALGLITLNRAKALNALSHAMVKAIASQLEAWIADAEIKAVAIKSTSEKAFSAGGDIRELLPLGQNKDPRFIDFYVDEYRLNRMIATSPKPYIAFIDGIVMGGGAGVSINGSHRIAGEGMQFAMPEVGIGFFPDVGATYFLPRLKGYSGTYLGLTGDRIGANDCVNAGVATAKVAADQFETVFDRLANGEAIDDVLADLSTKPEEGVLDPLMPLIDRVFCLDSVDAIMMALEKDATDDALQILSTMRQKSPTSLKIALRQMRVGAKMSIEEALQTEFRIVHRIRDGVEFYEGIRAAVIDKDRNPQWKPSTLDGVSDAVVDSYFAPIDGGDLTF